MPKTAQDGPKKLARPRQMGPGDLQGGRRERPQVQSCFQGHSETHENSKRGGRRCPRRPELTKSCVFYDVFCVLAFCGRSGSWRGGEASGPPQNCPEDSEDHPRRAPGGPQNRPSGLPERPLREDGGAQKTNMSNRGCSGAQMAPKGRPVRSRGPRASGMSRPRGGPQEGLQGL